MIKLIYLLLIHQGVPQTLPDPRTGIMSTNDQPKAPWPPSTETWHTYQLHCHCGTIRYKITISPPLFPEHDPQNTGTYDAVDCHCSYCVRNGILPIHPLAKNVEWEEKGLEWRKEYFTASKQHPHWFCGKCGSSLGTDLSGLPKEFVPEPRVGVNVS